MMPNVVRGGRMAGLMAYLAGPGRANEHVNQRLVAGDDRVTFAVEPGAVMSTDDALDVANVLDEPRKFHGTSVDRPVREWDEESEKYVTTGTKPGHVWHCSLSLRAEEGQLSDDQWRTIAEEFVTEMGFIDPDGAKSSRWAAIHHGASAGGNDHIHIAVQLVREDGTKANVHHDYKRAQQACATLEKKHGLQVVEGREQGRTVSADKPAERARAEAEKQPQNHRDELRRRLRGALAGADSQADYVKNLTALGVQVAPRFAKGSTEHVVGYKVALPAAKYTDGSRGETIWYAPSKLDSQLAWPRIRERFDGRGEREVQQHLAGFKSGATAQPEKVSRIPEWSPQMVEKLMSGKTTPDTLANIYARVSMAVERDRPGALNSLSKDHAQLSQGRGNGYYAMRTQHRMRSKDPAAGWKAVLQQANRLARMNAATQVMKMRPQWAAQTQQRLSSAEALIGARTAGSTPTQTVSTAQRMAQLGGRASRPPVNRTPRGDQDRGR